MKAQKIILGGETMKTLRRIKSDEMQAYKDAQKTEHITRDRADRIEAYNTAQWLDAFEVDKNHPHGTEAHIIDARGYIHIYNTRTKRHITVLSARPAQIKRYYKDLRIRYSEQIAQAIRIAYIRNEATGANHF